MDKEAIRNGIKAYSYEQKLLLRLLRKRGQFSGKEFDNWFQGREFRKRTRLTGQGITGDTLLLGIGANGFNMWATYLDLLQHMIVIDLVDAKTENGIVIYRLANGS